MKKNIPPVGARIVIALLMMPFILWFVPFLQQSVGIGGMLVFLVIIFGIMVASNQPVKQK